MRVYMVGGAVRDRILGRVPNDIDYMVVGGSQQEMLDLGYKQVGKQFPVFLHPETKCEYALARRERKSGQGHADFEFDFGPEVSLEEDLQRRDFTINAIALDEQSGQLLDPYMGRRDISLRLLRHVAPAFKEDPLRVLRAARYAADLGFTIAPETMALVKQMVAGGELANLSTERIWQELARGLMSARPVVFVNLLREMGALAVLLPEVERLFGVPQNKASHPEGCAGVHTMLVLGVAVVNHWPLEVRLAALLHDLGKACTKEADLPSHPGHEASGAGMAQEICERLRVPKSMARVVVAATREHGLVHKYSKLDARERVELFNRLDVWRGSNCLDGLLALCDCDHASHPEQSNFSLHPQRRTIMEMLGAAASADTAKAAQDAPSDAKSAVLAARVERVERSMAGTSPK